MQRKIALLNTLAVGDSSRVAIALGCGDSLLISCGIALGCGDSLLIFCGIALGCVSLTAHRR
jgi:hypothetical protein